MNRLDSQDDNLLIAIAKKDERWIIMYQEQTRPQALRQLGRWASNPELSFNWYDAAVMSQRIRNT